MYASKLTLAVKYNYLEEKFVKAYQWLSDTDLTSLAPGAYPICDGITANIQAYTTVPAETAFFEAHDQYFDIQYLVSGMEQFGICNREGLIVKNSDPSNDMTLFEEPAQCGSVLLLPGDFIVVAPEDAHKPRCIAKEACDVKKVVVKVRV